MGPGELGGRGDIGRTKVTETGSVDSDQDSGEFGGSKEPSAQGTGRTVWLGDDGWGTWEQVLFGVTSDEA